MEDLVYDSTIMEPTLILLLGTRISVRRPDRIPSSYSLDAKSRSVGTQDAIGVKSGGKTAEYSILGVMVPNISL